jgi:oligosaccharide 4-alpha-D-glucosyltransferase
MKYFVTTFLASLLFISSITGQIAWLKPSNPKPDEKITLYFNPAEGNAALKDYKGTVYLHTGVITNRSLDGGDWKHVIGNWGEADERVRMHALDNGNWSFTFVMKDFYGLRIDETPKMLAYVFRSENGGLVGKTKTNDDIFLAVNDYLPPKKQNSSFIFDNRKYISHFKDGQNLKVLTDKGLVEIFTYTDDMVEVVHFANSIGGETKSDAVILKPEYVFTELEEYDGSLVFKTNNLSIRINKDPFFLSFNYNGSEILSEEKGFYKREQNNGLRFKFQRDEKLFGLGERANSFDLVGARYNLYNRPKYGYEFGARNINYSVPLLFSSRKYILLFDNPQKGYADIGETEPGILEWGAIGGSMKYFLVAGDSYKDIMSSYGKLTGNQPLPPIWALGNLQSRMAYRTQYETDSIVSLMQEKDFPLDAVILDFYWFGDSIMGTMGRLDWYKPNWPGPEKMIAGFRKKGVKTVLITEPYILDTLENFTIADSLNILALDSMGNSYVNREFYFGDGGLIDIFKPTARQWFWQQYEKQMDIGVAGWWGDLGEPENHPSDQIHINGKADEVHNIYAHYWHKMLFENYRKNYPDRRLFNLNRAGYAGSQRYSIFPWTGDVSRSWGGLKAQIPLMLNMSLSGLPFIHSDAGGFAQGTKNDELYTRWLQMACFSPILRPHGSGIPSEAVYFNDTTQRIVRNFMKLRYSLLPYIYTAAAQAHINGYPIIRPLFFEFPEDGNALNADWEYMFGESILVRPIFEEHQKKVDVYLPEGNYWYNFWTNERFDGGQWISIKTDLETIPLFIKSGSFIAMAEAVNSTDDYNTDKLTVKYYLGETGSNSSQIYFEDDGKTFGTVEDEKYSELEFVSAIYPESITIRINKEAYSYTGMPDEREIKLVLIGFAPQKKSIQARLVKQDLSEKKIKFRIENSLPAGTLNFENKNLKIIVEK